MTVSFGIFGATCILVYLSSTLYHSLTYTSAKYVFRKIDHSVIFLYIAGSYTPIIVFVIRNSWNWIILTCIWLIAIIGILIQIFKKNNFKISILIYLLFGWLAVFMAKPFLLYLQTPIIFLLLAGGIFYTIGLFFYLSRKLFFHHVIWHLFVIGGGLCHYFAVYNLK